MISINQLTVSFGGYDLFKEATFLVNPKDRIGLVGKNGAGKSTLLKIFAGKQEATSGEIVIPRDLRIGYLPQQMVHLDGRTVIEETRMAFDEILSINAEIAQLQKTLAEAQDYTTPAYEKAMHRLVFLNERFDLLGGHTMDAEAEKTLLGLGFLSTDFNRPTSEFSGGWRMRIELAKVLLCHPQVLLLDEPTNHLDIESIQWLESFLKEYNGALVLVSHDRAFLDNVTTRTVEISLGKIYDYNVSYTTYTVLRKERREQQLAAYRNQQKMIKDTEDFIERFRYKPTKSVQVQSRIKQLNKIERIEVDEEDLSAIRVKFPPAPRSGLIVIEARDLEKRYGDHVVFSHLNLQIHRGEKVALVGKNGEGKSTFSKMVMNEIEPTQGELKVGHNVNIGYFAQNQDEIMNGELTVFETIDQIAVGDIRTKIRDLLGAFLFGGSDVDKKVKVLSGGERSRLAMVKLLLEPYNLLVLDEPTNHLDLRSKEVLKQALLAYDGTLVVVSHDRDFLGGLTQKVYEFKDRNIKEYIGDVYDFLAKKQLTSLQSLNTSVLQASAAQEEKETSGKTDYAEKKRIERQQRQFQNQVQQAENQIDEIEKAIKDVERKLAYPELNTDGNMTDLYLLYDQYKKQQEEAMGKWEQAFALLEQFQTSNNL